MVWWFNQTSGALLFRPYLSCIEVSMPHIKKDGIKGVENSQLKSTFLWVRGTPVTPLSLEVRLETLTGLKLLKAGQLLLPCIT